MVATDRQLRNEPPPAAPPLATLAGLALAATSIGALLAQMYGLASMATFGRYVTAPGTVALVVLASVRRPGLEEVQRRIRVGVVAGVVGVIGYDVVRIPFAAIGMRVFAPIDSYGLMLSGQHMASPGSNTLGWLFHLSNGVTFGVIYALVAARRHWIFGVAWGLVLESAAFLGPFTAMYGLSGQTEAIVVAYGAHLAYGYPLGRLVQRMDATDRELREMARRPTATVLVVAVLAIFVWHRPWTTPAARNEAGRLATQLHQPVAFVRNDRFSPEWLRVRSGDCIVVANRSSNDYQTAFGDVPANGNGRLCFTSGETAAKRVKLGPEAYSGGFVLVERR